MSNMQATSVPSDLDARIALFEERMFKDEATSRPQRTRTEILNAAIETVKAQVAAESIKLGGRFRMAAQQQAQRETVADLEWLEKDLEKLRDEEVSGS